MVLTREIKEELELAVNVAVSKALKSDSLISQIVKKVSEAVVKTVDDKLLKIESNLAKLEEKYEKLDQGSRSNNLRVFKLEEKPNEDVRDEIKKLIKTRLSLKISDNDIETCYRVGKKENGKTRGIFIKFINHQTKQAVYEKKKLLKGTGVVMREDLTSTRMQLLNQVVEKAGLKNTWTNNGKIYAKKNNTVFKIDNKNDVSKLC